MIYSLTDDTFYYLGALAGKSQLKLRQYDNRLWAVCDDGSIVFSNNGDATTWDAANVIWLPNREPAIDFLPVQGGVIITHRLGAYALYGSGTYQDTSILPIQAAATDPVFLTDSAVAVENVVYVLGNQAVHAISLNGIQEIPHDQAAYFKANYSVWNAQGQAIQGVYLYKFHSILYLFNQSYGSQGFLFNIKTGAFQKINQTLSALLPYMLGLNDSQTDFLLGAAGSINRSIYSSGILTVARQSTMQTRHEDGDSMREKIWRYLGIIAAAPIRNLRIRYALDHGALQDLKFGVLDLQQGDNIIHLYDNNGSLLRSKSLSLELSIGNQVYLVDDVTGEPLADNVTGELLVDETLDTHAAAFDIKEIRLKLCEAGPTS